MQREFVFPPLCAGNGESAALQVAGRLVPLALVRHRRARRYLLRVREDGSAQVTVPPRGSWLEARLFAANQSGWIARQLERLADRPQPRRHWRPGDQVWFRGAEHPLSLAGGANGWTVRIADQVMALATPATDLRPPVIAHLRQLAARELPPRVRELAEQASLTCRRVTVRDQRSRWGSCSRRGTVSLNWRLVQMPPWVSDYVIWHELMHLREMNHSRRFWREVAMVCPRHAEARRWLRTHGAALR